MPLIRLDRARYGDLVSSWRGACASFGEEFDDFAPAQLEHAYKICSEDPPDTKYGIFAVEHDVNFDTLVHLNRALLPQTSGHTLRLLWVLLSPVHDLGDISPETFSRITTDVIYSSIELAKGKMEADNVKIYLGSLSDRKYFEGIASILRRTKELSYVGIRGNWFHLSIKKLVPDG